MGAVRTPYIISELRFRVQGLGGLAGRHVET